jgi:DNA-directed RNA polymerase specialized sigma24 family protein
MDDSITHWIQHLKSGDADAAGRLWDEYFERLTRLARARMRQFPRRVTDEEDVALSVFDSLCRGAARGIYPKLSDRDNLWSLLVVITSRKVCDYITAERAQKRGGGAVAPVSDLDADSSGARVLDAVLSREPTPEVAVVFAEECERLLARLDPELRRVAVGKMEGLSNEELASELDCGLRTIERRLRLIRQTWTGEND